MSNEEINSAELEAEQILEGEYTKARAEECPEGLDCPVHFRVDSVLFDESMHYARLITYVGEYAVVTEDNHKLDDPMIMVKILMGRIKKEDLPPRWETAIFVVGTGTLGELSDRSIEERRDALRYLATHDDWKALEGTHSVTVAALEQGLIDVSKPWTLES